MSQLMKEEEDKEEQKAKAKTQKMWKHSTVAETKQRKEKKPQRQLSETGRKNQKDIAV